MGSEAIISPLSNINLVSLLSRLESLCTIIIVVLPLLSSFSVVLIPMSEELSKDDVASSKINIGASLRNALAIDILCL